MRNWDIAQAIRDSDDEEAKHFFHGMSPLQVSILRRSVSMLLSVYYVVSASSSLHG